MIEDIETYYSGNWDEEGGDLLMAKTVAAGIGETEERAEQFIFGYTGNVPLERIADTKDFGSDVLSGLKKLGDETKSVVVLRWREEFARNAAEVRAECARVLKRNGAFISIGPDTNGCGEGFLQLEILIISSGENRADVLCLAEVKE